MPQPPNYLRKLSIMLAFPPHQLMCQDLLIQVAKIPSEINCLKKRTIKQQL